MEEWRDIKGYEGLYQVSNEGRIKSFYLGKEKIRKLCNDKDGYLIVSLWKRGVSENPRVHRLVAEAFIPNPNNLPIVNHKDENKQNNMVWVNDDGSIDYNKSNLEWCTVKYNTNYGTCLEKRKEKRKGWKPTKESIEKMAEKHKKPIGMYKDGILIKRFESAADAERENNNYKNMSISAACNGRIKTYRGYEWKFIE